MNTQIIDQAVEELNGEIARIQNAIVNLQGLRGGERANIQQPTTNSEHPTETRNAERGVRNGEGTKAKRGPYKKRTATSNIQHSTPNSQKEERGGAGLTNPKVVATIRKMPEPITTEALKATGLFADTKGASNWITRALAQGWLSRSGRGEYKRTREFGGTAAAAASDTLAELKRDMQQPDED
jgi:hypothetical protein